MLQVKLNQCVYVEYELYLLDIFVIYIYLFICYIYLFSRFIAGWDAREDFYSATPSLEFPAWRLDCCPLVSLTHRGIN